MPKKQVKVQYDSDDDSQGGNQPAWKRQKNLDQMQKLKVMHTITTNLFRLAAKIFQTTYFVIRK